MAEDLSVRAGMGAPSSYMIAQPCRSPRKDGGRQDKVGRTSSHGRAERGRVRFYPAKRPPTARIHQIDRAAAMMSWREGATMMGWRKRAWRFAALVAAVVSAGCDGGLRFKFVRYPDTPIVSTSSSAISASDLAAIIAAIR